MILHRKRKCCDDNFSTLSVRARWITVILMVITLVVGFVVLLYLFAIEKAILNKGGDDGKTEVVAPLISEEVEESDWSPKCLNSKNPFERFDCYPENNNVSAKQCSSRGCCWSDDDSFPQCFYPENYGYERSSPVQQYYDGLEVYLNRQQMPSRYGDDVQHIRIRAEYQMPYRLRVKFYDPEVERYEVPEPKIHAVIPGPNDPMLDIQMYSIVYNTTSLPFHFKLRRTNTDTIIFDTSVGGLTFAHQFLQISSKLASSNLYGLGDNEFSRFKLNLNQTKWTLFSRNYLSEPSAYGAHPFYICMEDDGKAHGVLLLNSNALEIELQEMPAVTFRALGGILDFYFFLGPTMEDVVHQYLEAVGYPFMPPYWALGLHAGITHIGSVEEIRQLVQEMNARYIPKDAVHLGTYFLFNHTMIPSHDSADIENVYHLQEDVHAAGQKLTLAFGPGIPSDQPRGKYPMYDHALLMGLCINSSSGGLLEGIMWSNKFAFLDFGNPLTVHWLTQLIEENHISFHYDGVRLEMEAPINFVDGSIKGCPQDNLNKPPYVPNSLKGPLYKNTLCMNVKQWWGDIQYHHYNLHNLHGMAVARAYYKAQKVLNKHIRPLTISSSTYPGSGQYSGHILPIGNATWADLSRTVSLALQYSLYGTPLVGVDACISEESDEELCLRWLQLGSFLPLFYSSSFHIISEVPNTSDDFTQALLHLVNRRYELLPYLYTLFHRAHTKGETVLRPLMHEYPNDNITYSIDTQFLWGPALLIVPVLEKEVQSYSVYIPRDIWYDYHTGELWRSNGTWQTMQTSLYGNGTESFLLLIRSGYILPLQEPGNNTMTSRKNPMRLVVALDDEQRASGELMWDDGQTPDSYSSGEYVHVKFIAENGDLTISSHLGKSVFHSNFDNVHIQDVQIFGLNKKPMHVTFAEGYYLSEKQVHWDEQFNVLQLKNIIVPLTMKTVIHWFYV